MFRFTLKVAFPEGVASQKGFHCIPIYFGSLIIYIYQEWTILQAGHPFQDWIFPRLCLNLGKKSTNKHENFFNFPGHLLWFLYIHFPYSVFPEISRISLNFPINVESGLQVVLRSFLREYVICTLSRCCHLVICLVGWLFYVSSTWRLFRDGTPLYCPLRRTWSSVFIPFPPGIEPRAVAWQSITLPLRHTAAKNSK